MNLNITESTYYDIQQNSEEWFEIKRGRLSASPAHTLWMKETSEGYKDYVFQKAYERLFNEEFPGKFNGNYYTEQGHEREERNRERYENETFYKVRNGGVFVLDDWICASPDGIIETDGLLELKGIISGKQYRKRIQNDFKPDREHLEQCMFQLYVTNRKWVDLVYYAPTEQAKLSIQRIYRDEEMISEMRELIEKMKIDINQQIETLKTWKH